MTLNPAYAAGEEAHAGRLAVFADSPLTVAATDLPRLPVLLTVLDGHTTHRDADI
ncbi:hypothetical protein [Streptomyces sp. NPDC048155]|uniref:hypothetical protein n=1 Tax=Streptomyces sp. NPDC048155 TaxID=3154818 RepID=UPI0033E304D7